MKILITNTTLCNFFGSQVFTYTLAMELKKQGHEVFCFTSVLGQVADRLQENGIPVFVDVRHIPDGIDVIHAQHRNESLLAFAGFQQTPMVLVCHGVLPLQEQPFRSGMNIRRYVAVSEEVRNHLVEKHGICASKISIVRNGVDLARFTCKKPINSELKNVLVLSNNSAPQQLSVIRRACEEKGISVKKIGFPAENVWNVEDHINDADLVVTLGRGVLEAAACKRVVVVYDYNGGDGLVTKQTFPIFRQKSFSGRTKGIQYTEEQFKEVLDQYNPKIADEVYQFIPELSFDSIARKYCDIYQQAIADFTAEPIAARQLYADVSNGISELIKDFKTDLDQQSKALRKKTDELEDLTRRYEQKSQEASLERRTKEELVRKLEAEAAENREQITQLEKKLGQSENEVALRGEQILELRKEVDLRTEQILELRKEGDLRTEQVQQLREEMGRARELREELEKRVQLQEADLAERTEQVKQVEQLRERELAQRDERIRLLDEEIAQATKVQLAQKSALAEKNVALADLEAQLRQIEEEVAREARLVNETIRSKDETIRSQGDLRETGATHLLEMEKRLASLQAANEELKTRHEQLMLEKDQRIDDLLNSMSWKVTGPLRKVYGLLTGRH